MFAIGVVLGAVLLFVAVRQVDWPAVAGALRSVSPLWLTSAAVLAASAQALFAARWYGLVVSNHHEMTFGDAFDFLAIGALAGLVLPPRLSDVARAVAASRYHATSATGLFGTIVIERLLDVLMLVAFGAAVSALMPVPPLLRGALATLLAIVIAAVIVFWLGDRGPLGIVGRWAGRWRGPGSRVHDWTSHLLAGTGIVRERGRMPRALLVSMAGWICAAASASSLLAAFSAPAPWFAGAFVIVIINLAGILPAPPAGLGVYHYSAMAGATPWIADPSAAFAYAVISHALSVGIVMILGTWSLARKGLSLRALRRMADAQADEKGVV